MILKLTPYFVPITTRIPLWPLFCIFYVQKQDILRETRDPYMVITFLKLERYGKGFTHGYST